MRIILYINTKLVHTNKKRVKLSRIKMVLIYFFQSYFAHEYSSHIPVQSPRYFPVGNFRNG